MSLRFALDTNIVSALFRPSPPRKLMARFQLHFGQCGLPSPVWHELRFGAESLPPSKRRDALEGFLSEFILPEVPILPYDRAAAEYHASERARLSRAGRTSPFVDGQIAAITAVLGLTLVTDNTADFQPFEDVRTVNWLK